MARFHCGAFLLALASLALWCGLVALPAAAQVTRQFTVTYQSQAATFEDDGDAEEGIKDKLTRDLGERLLRVGFGAAAVQKILEKAKFTKMEYSGALAHVKTRAGDQDTRRVYKIDAVVTLTLDDEDVKRLFNDLRGTKLENLSGCEKHNQRLEVYRGLGGEEKALAELRDGLLANWVAIAQKSVTDDLAGQEPGAPAYLEALANNWLALKPLFAAYSHGAGEVVKAYQTAVLKYASQYDGSREALDQYLTANARMQGMIGQAFPELANVIRDAAAIKRKEKLNALLDDAGASLTRLKEEFTEAFAQFRDAAPIQQLAPRYREVVAARMLLLQPGELSPLAAMAGDVRDFAAAFPESQERQIIQDHLAKLCAARLPKLEIKTGDDLRNFETAWEVCRSLFEEAALRKKIQDKLDGRRTAVASALHEEDLEKSLGASEFLAKWNKAFGDANWGRGKDNFYSRGELRALWGQGVDAARCECLTGENEICRQYQSPDGRNYEVIARFSDSRLYEIELCGLYIPGGSDSLYRFLRSKYKVVSPDGEVQAFFAGATGTLTQQEGLLFKDEKRGQAVQLRRQGDLSRVAFRSLQEEARRKKTQEAKRRTDMADDERSRMDRLKRGFKPGDCVRWNCEADCLFEGRVKAMAGQKVQVVITRSEEDPYDQGKKVELAPTELFDCD